MLYSASCEYAIRALTYLARQPEGALSLLADIADSEGVPGPFLGKILHDLVKAGILRSARGPTGGYALALSAGEITLLHIRETLDGTGDLERCAVGLDPCSDTTPCPLHDTYKPLRGAIRSYLEETTVEDLARGFELKLAAISDRGRTG